MSSERRSLQVRVRTFATTEAKDQVQLIQVVRTVQSRPCSEVARVFLSLKVIKLLPYFFLITYFSMVITNVRIQAFLFKAPQADFSMQNVGGCRRGISVGDVTAENVIGVLPFSNTLVTVNMEGSLIKETLEDALNNFLRDDDLKGSTGSFPASAGLRWELDYTAEFGNRVSNIEMNRRLEEDKWTPLDMSSNYTVAITCECTITCWQENIYVDLFLPN